MASALSLHRSAIPTNSPTAAPSVAPPPSAPGSFTTCRHHGADVPPALLLRWQRNRWRGISGPPLNNKAAWRTMAPPPCAGPKADDSSSARFEMTVEIALKLLGVSEGASFDDILRARNTMVASCKGDEDAIAEVEAAYEMLLMQSLTQRRSGKVLSNSVRYADVRTVKSAGERFTPQWLQSAMKNVPLSIETPTTSSLGIEAGVYGALMVFTYASGTSLNPVGSNSGDDVPGLVLAIGFGASLYFLAKKNINLGKAALITVGGLVAGAAVGSAVENWLQVDIVPFLGVRSPAVIVSEFVLLSQFLVSLYLR